MILIMYNYKINHYSSFYIVFLFILTNEKFQSYGIPSYFCGNLKFPAGPFLA